MGAFAIVGCATAIPREIESVREIIGQATQERSG
jgi:hypothetical protein